MRLTLLYANGTTLEFVVSHYTGNPSIEIIQASTDVSNTKTSISIRLSPELIALLDKVSLQHTLTEGSCL